jgi:hypothetical protein
MAATLVRKVMLRIAADDGDTEAKLDAISARADELAAKHPELKVRIDSAAAYAKLLALRRELNHTEDDSVGLKTRLGALGQALNALTLGVSGGWGEMTMLQKVITGLGVATGLGEPLVAGLTVAVGGLSSGLVAAGAGLGVFGLVAKSALTQASTAATAAQTAQTAYGSAVQNANLTYQQSMAAATTAAQRHAAAVAQANAVQSAGLTRTQALNAAYSGMSQQQIQLGKSITTAKNDWQSFVQSNTAGVSKILSQGLGLLPVIFKAIQPLLAPAEKALSGLIAGLSQAIQPFHRASMEFQGFGRAAAGVNASFQAAGGGGLQSFIRMLAANTGPAITKLGQAVGHIGVGLGGIIRAFMPFAQDMLSGLDKITGAFAKWGSTLSGHTGFQSLMSTFRSETPKAVGVLKNLAVVVKNVVSAMAGMSTASNSKMLLQVLGPLSGILARLSKNTGLVRIGLYLLAAADAGKKLKTAFQGIQGAMGVFKTGASAFQDLRAGFSNSAAAASEATGAWGTFGGKISGLGSMLQQAAAKMGLLRAATVEGTEAQEGLDVAMEANPIGLIVAAIAALVAGIVLAYIHFRAFRDVVNDVGRAIRAGFLDALHAVERAVSAVVSFVRGHWQLLLAILAGPIGLAVLFIKDHWHQIVKDTSQFVSDATGEVRRLGTDVIRFFKSAFDRVTGDVHNWELDVLRVFERLPGKIIGAIAGLPGMMFRAGVHVIESLIGGIGSMVGKLGSVMGGIASKAAGFFGLSPAKEGPLSGGGAPEIRGQHFAADIARGMTSGLPRIGTAAARLAGAAALGAGASPALAGAGGGGRLQVEWVGGQSDQQFLTWIKRNIRIRGGDVSNMGR